MGSRARSRRRQRSFYFYWAPRQADPGITTLRELVAVYEVIVLRYQPRTFPSTTNAAINASAACDVEGAMLARGEPDTSLDGTRTSVHNAPGDNQTDPP